MACTYVMLPFWIIGAQAMMAAIPTLVAYAIGLNQGWTSWQKFVAMCAGWIAGTLFAINAVVIEAL